MKVSELAAILEAEPAVDRDREISCGLCCDLLSHVMANGRENMAWVTVHTHMNVAAIAVFTGASCVIAADGRKFPRDVIEKAREEGIALLECKKSAYAICKAMAQAGIE